MKPFFSSDCGPCLSVAFLCKKIHGPQFSRCVFVYDYLDQKHALFPGKAAHRTFKFIKRKHENTGAGHISTGPCLNLNRRISTGPCRMKTAKWPYTIGSSRLFIFRYQVLFWRSSSASTVYFNVNNVMMTSSHQAPS